MARARRGFGWIRRLPSKRYQASYVGADGLRHVAPKTFETKADAEGWLAGEYRRLAEPNAWEAPEVRAKAGIPFGEYAGRWLATRELTPKTKRLYQGMLVQILLPEFETKRLKAIRPVDVRSWYGRLDPSKPTRRAHAYSLLKAILATAVVEELIPMNPCTIKGAGQTKRARDIEIASYTQLKALTEAMPERLRLMIGLGGYCGLRFGEVTELRRKDIDVNRMVVHVKRGVTLLSHQPVHIGKPKSAKGIRSVDIPSHLKDDVRYHLATFVAPGQNALLFPHHPGEDKHITSGWFYKMAFLPAREKAGLPHLRFHDLRHTAATHLGQLGGTLPEIMALIGHSTVKAAMEYQQKGSGRGRVLMDGMAAAALAEQAQVVAVHE